MVGKFYQSKARAVRVMLASEIEHNLLLLTQFVDAIEFHKKPVDHNNLGVAHKARVEIAQNLIRIPLPHFTTRMIDASPDLFLLGASNMNLKPVIKHYVLLGRIVDIHKRICALDSMSQRFVDLTPGMIEDLKRYAEEVQETGNPMTKNRTVNKLLNLTVKTMLLT